MVTMFKTRVTELFEIEYPLIAGGMLWLSRAELAAAVSNAGGLGIISSASFENKEQLREEIKKAKTLTNKPFGVNIPLLPAVRPLDIDGYIKVLVEEGVRIVETAGRSPESYMELFKENGVKVMHKVTAVRFALKAQQVGCDAVIIDGCECGGHPGEEDITSMILVPRAVDALDIPVIAAGGFADGRGLVAALALGAEGVLMGTRFMVSQESPLHDNVKKHLLSLKETDTLYVLRSQKNTARVIKNNVAEKVAQMEAEGAKLEEILPLVSGLKGKQLIEEGNIEAGILACGQVIGLIEDCPSVQEIIHGIIKQGVDVRKRLLL
jgi:NAD(P)H-dependent flavin oxidoreductase YrpB (nitropropane dioxygenase family)